MAKTLLLSEIFPPRTGGSGRWFWEIYRRLPQDVCIVGAGEDPEQEAFDRQHDLRVVRLPLTLPAWGLRSLSGLCGYAKAFRRVGSLISSHNIDRLHCGRLLPEGWLGWLLKKRYGTPYVCYVHGEETNYGILSRELGWMMRRVIRGADCLIANSQNTSTLLRNNWNVPEAKIQVLHPGVDIDHFVPVPPDSAVRSELQWHERRVILTVGRLQERKGHDQLIRALPEILGRVPNVLYAIVGEGEERERLERLVTELNVSEHVQFLGEIRDDRLVRCYQQCDLFVLPNREIDGDIEGFGMVLLEAQACGKPVVAGDSGGTAETMKVPETGRIVDCETPDQLVVTLIELLENDALRESMGQAGRIWTTEQFGWEALSLQAKEVFALAIFQEGDVENDIPSEGNGPSSHATCDKVEA